jgi:predicted  nucleic acid-binding Zn-ribbon protein
MHVVLSMLLTAGVVVFVNRVDQYDVTVKTLKQAAATSSANAAASANDAAAAKDALAKAESDLVTQVESARKDKADATAQIADLNVKLADATKQVAIVQADNAKLTNTVAASQSAQAQYFAQVTDLRNKVDDLTKSKLELDTAVADLTNQRDVLEKQRRDLAEKVSMLDTQYNTAVAAMKDAHINIDDKLHTPGTGAGAPPINGVIVSDVTMIGPVPYATISLGSADAVVKGMEFKVIDRDKGQFLGVLTVESVDTTEATGRLNGPGVKNVHKGVEVRTQL